MILENTVPNPKSVAPKLQKLQSRKVSINVGRHQQRHQSGKNYSLAKMNFVETKTPMTMMRVQNIQKEEDRDRDGFEAKNESETNFVSNFFYL
jgi:UDP-N-acetylmuramoylalanine-D-glutamate ligase